MQGSVGDKATSNIVPEGIIGMIANVVIKAIPRDMEMTS